MDTMVTITSNAKITTAPTSNGKLMTNHIEHKRVLDHVFHEVDEDIIHHGDEEVEDTGNVNLDDGFEDPQVSAHLDNSHINNNNLARHDFLVSFLVDARGGALNGCRHTGVKVIIPPKTAPQPMRITCRYVKRDALLYPPPLNEGEGLACRILQVGPKGSKFLGPVMIEVPHIASLRGGEREVVVLRCDSSVKGKWTEHNQEQDIDEKILKDILDDSLSSTASSGNSSTASPVPRGPLVREGSRSGSRSGPSPTPQHQNSSTALHGSFHQSPPERPHQVIRILAKEFPQYFAVITRNRQDILQIGSEGGLLRSTQMTKAQVNIRPKSLVKTVNVGLSVVQVEDANAEEILKQGGSVSPILTIEPRRRKFHRAITITMPLPTRTLQRQVVDAQHRSQSPSVKKNATTSGVAKGPIGSLSKPSILPPDPVEEALTPAKKTTKKKRSKSNHESLEDEELSKTEMSLRLLCSMSGNYSKACWEDVTESTPMMLQLDEDNDLIVKAEISNNCNHGTQDQSVGKVTRQNQKQDNEETVQFTSIISASFFLVNCPNWTSCDLTSLVDQMHKRVSKVPYFARFHVYARRNPITNVFAPNNHRPESPHCGTATTSSSSGKVAPTINHIRVAQPTAAHVRILCISEPDRAINPLELQEDFVEICRSDFVEIFEKTEIDIKFGGNVIQTCRESVSAHGSSLANVSECDGACQEFDYGLGKRVVIFQPFGENRQGFSVRRRNDKNPFAKGTITFLNANNNKVFYEEKIDLTKFM